MSRFEEVVNEAIGEVDPRRGGLQGRDARAAHRRATCASARARCAPRSRSTARYPEHKPAPVSGIPTQEIYTLFGSAVASRARHAAARRRRRPGHDRLPVRAGAGRRRRARAARRRRLHRRRDRADPRGTSPSPRTTSAASARSTSAAPRECDDEIEARRRCCEIVEGSMSLGDLRADEAQRRGRGGREGAPPPALRRGLRARDDRRRRRALPRAADDGRSSRPARRTSRRSTSTTSSPSASACSASCGASSRPASTPRTTRRCAPGSTAQAEQRTLHAYQRGAAPRRTAGPLAATVAGSSQSLNAHRLKTSSAAARQGYLPGDR